MAKDAPPAPEAKPSTSSKDGKKSEETGKSKKKGGKPVDKALEALLEEAKGLKRPSVFKVMREGKGNWFFFFMGCVGAVINGGLFPAFSIFFGELFNVFFLPPDRIRSEVWFYGYIFLALAGVSLITNFLSTYFFKMFGDRIGANLRAKYFGALLRRQIVFFDKRDSSTLVNRIGIDITTITRGVSEAIGDLVTVIGALILGVGIAFFYSWQFTLILLALFPIILVSSMLQFAMIGDKMANSSGELGNSSQIASEAFTGIKTLKSFTQEGPQTTRYTAALKKALSSAKTKALKAGLGAGAAVASIFVVYGLGMGLGGGLVADGVLQGGDLLVVFFAILIGLSQLAQLGSTIPDIAKGRAAAALILHTINGDEMVETSGKETPSSVQGSISISNVDFVYPTRPDAPVLNKFTLNIPAGSTTALCGPSGGGKSTIISLIERFYDPTAGSITLDGTPLSNLDLHWLRSQIGLVSQEPILFSGSIAENLRYGRADATEEDLVEACKKANAHDFISTLPDGYNTDVGEKGTQLSGGQKQRVAIARALLKDPKILLLDEATSALDSESEGIVQEALDRLMVGRTSVVIAHRLSTIRDADQIVVVGGGAVLETGTHDSLMAAGGHYAKLNSRQAESGDKR